MTLEVIQHTNNVKQTATYGVEQQLTMVDNNSARGTWLLKKNSAPWREWVIPCVGRRFAMNLSLVKEPYYLSVTTILSEVHPELLRNRTACKMLRRNASKHNENPSIYKLQNISTWNMKFLFRKHHDYMRDEQPGNFLPIADHSLHYHGTPRPTKPPGDTARYSEVTAARSWSSIWFVIVSHNSFHGYDKMSCVSMDIWFTDYMIIWHQSRRWERSFVCPQCPTGGSRDTHVWRVARELIKHMRHFNL
jgi:hypothetical protein